MASRVLNPGPAAAGGSARRTAVGRLLAASVAAVLYCAVSGCTRSDDDKFVAVGGKVTLDGKDLTVGTVSFRPDASKGNQSMHVPTGEIDAQGNYELVTVGKKGAPAGWYRVLVFADGNVKTAGAPPPHPLPPKWLMNVKYIDEKATDLFVEVVEKPEPGAYDLKVSK